jgi:hypothetical protein
LNHQRLLAPEEQVASNFEQTLKDYKRRTMSMWNNNDDYRDDQDDLENEQEPDCALDPLGEDAQYQDGPRSREDCNEMSEYGNVRGNSEW